MKITAFLFGRDEFLQLNQVLHYLVQMGEHLFEEKLEMIMMMRIMFNLKTKDRVSWYGEPFQLMALVLSSELIA